MSKSLNLMHIEKTNQLSRGAPEVVWEGSAWLCKYVSTCIFNGVQKEQELV